MAQCRNTLLRVIAIASGLWARSGVLTSKLLTFRIVISLFCGCRGIVDLMG